MRHDGVSYCGVTRYLSKQIMRRIRVLGRHILESERIDEVLLIYLANLTDRYIRLITYDPIVYAVPPKRAITIRINDFSDATVERTFGLGSVEKLRRLYNSFCMPEQERTPTRHMINTEAAFLIGLKRLKYPCKYSDLIIIFGGDPQDIRRHVNYFLDYIDENCKGLISNSIHFWKPHFAQFATKIKAKLIDQGCNFLAGQLLTIMSFIDNTIISTCSPGTGPVEDGIGSRRKPRTHQQAFYTGWKHLHGVKIQFVTLPNGMIGDASVVASVRHNDAYMVNRSEINERLADCQLDDVVQHVTYGDSAYNSEYSHIRSMFVGDNLTMRQRWMNHCLNKCRETIEWVNKDVKQKFAFIDYGKSLKLGLAVGQVSKCIIASALLHNCYNCLNYTQTVNYFDCTPPTLEEYMALAFPI